MVAATMLLHASLDFMDFVGFGFKLSHYAAVLTELLTAEGKRMIAWHVLPWQLFAVEHVEPVTRYDTLFCEAHLLALFHHLPSFAATPCTILEQKRTPKFIGFRQQLVGLLCRRQFFGLFSCVKCNAFRVARANSLFDQQRFSKCANKECGLLVFILLQCG